MRVSARVHSFLPADVGPPSQHCLWPVRGCHGDSRGLKKSEPGDREKMISFSHDTENYLSQSTSINYDLYAVRFRKDYSWWASRSATFTIQDRFAGRVAGHVRGHAGHGVGHRRTQSRTYPGTHMHLGQATGQAPASPLSKGGYQAPGWGYCWDTQPQPMPQGNWLSMRPSLTCIDPHLW